MRERIYISSNGGSGGSTVGGATMIPELSADPASPISEEAWVLRSGSAGGIPYSLMPLGLLMSSAVVSYTYQFSYRTLEGTTVRTTLS